MDESIELIESPAGALGVLHFTDIPFTPRRIYWLFDTPTDVLRGLHGHKSLQQYIFCVHGVCEVTVDDGRETRTAELDSRSGGLYVPAGVWRVIRFVEVPCVLMVVASEEYDPNDYIHDHDEFVQWVRANRGLAL